MYRTICARALCAVTFLVSLGFSVPAWAQVEMWISDSFQGLGTVNVHTGEVTTVFAPSETLTDIAFAPDGTFYGISETDLYRINPANGLLTNIGSHGISYGNALVFSSDGVLYGAGSTTSNLYTIDVSTGQSNSLGDMGYFSAGDLSFQSGQLYLSSTSNELIEVDRYTAASTLVGSFGVNNVFGMATGPDGNVYAGALTRLYSVDTSSGQLTYLSNYAGQGLGTIYGSAFMFEAVPEPSSVTILMAGAGLIGLRRRRRSVFGSRRP